MLYEVITKRAQAIHSPASAPTATHGVARGVPRDLIQPRGEARRAAEAVQPRIESDQHQLRHVVRIVRVVQHSGSPTEHARMPRLDQGRITSYNVCYTKLLRYPYW